MSRVGKSIITIPKEVKVFFDEKTNVFEASSGEFSDKVAIHHTIGLTIDDGTIQLFMKEKIEKNSKAYWGLYRSLIFNIIKGLSEGFSKTMLLVGIGYKASLIHNDKYILMVLGYSHDVMMEIPARIKVVIEGNNKIIVSCYNKQMLGDFCDKIRKCRKPEPYKGKGIRYEDEVIVLKEGKRK